MNYYIDQEFHERVYKPRFGKANHIIEMISIGIVDENGHEFYEVCNEFDIRAAWNNEWLRENVLRPIFLDNRDWVASKASERMFEFKNMKKVIERAGHSRSWIANSVCAFIYGDDCEGSGMSAIEMATKYEISDKSKEPVFYGYYADYDWVLFCSLFGNMMSLPKGFPMYCRDLKQTMDEKAEAIDQLEFTKILVETKDSKWVAQGAIGTHIIDVSEYSINERLALLKGHKDYPKHENEHKALSDAKWNWKLHEYLKNY